VGKKRAPRHRGKENIPDTEKTAQPTAPASWWSQVRNRALALVGAVVTAVAITVATAWANRTVPPPDPIAGGGFTATVETAPECDQAYALPKPIDPRTEAAPLIAVEANDHKAVERFLQDQGGAPVGTTTVEVVLTGTSTNPTRIQDVAVARLRKAPVIAGTRLGTRCEGESDKRAVTIDLDSTGRPLLKDGRPFFKVKNLDVSISERETLLIAVSARQSSYCWIFSIRHPDTSGKSATSFLGRDGRLHPTANDVPQSADFCLTGPSKKYSTRYLATGPRFYFDKTAE
jgi:hypothetical protein